MNNVAEEFEDNFEKFRNQSAHRIRCLMDLDGGVGLHIVRDKELLGFIVNGKIYIDADEIEVLVQKEDQKEDQEEEQEDE